MNTFEKKLKESSDNTEVQGQAIVDQARLLLSANEAEETKLLESVGLDWQIREAARKTEDIQWRKRHRDAMGRTIVSESELRDLCKRYRLYLLPASYYIGGIPATLAANLNKYVKEKNIPMPAHHGYSKFYIAAPPRLFREYRSPWSNFLSILKGGSVEMKEAYDKIWEPEQDPILCYKLDDGYWAIIDSWGKDNTLLRRLYAILTTETAAIFAGTILGLMVVGLPMIFATLICKYVYMTPDHYDKQHILTDGWVILTGLTWLAMLVPSGFALFVGLPAMIKTAIDRIADRYS